MKLHRAFSLLLCACLAFLPTAAARAQGPEPRLAEPEAGASAHGPNARKTPVVSAVARVKNAVVNIHSERTARGPATEELFALAPSQNRINGMGTGIIIDARGYVVTNNHVVEDVNLIRVRLADHSTHTAAVLARDQENDLALLKIDTNKPLAVMPLGTSTDIMVGETVIAIGNAYGYEHTVSVGVVSAIHRDVNLNKELSYRNLIQTDASINPGNSGGPLMNVNGELIGVNVAIRAGAQGIGFAIPVDTMIQVVREMICTKKRCGTWHGMICNDTLETVESGLARSVILQRAEAAGPAALAGLRKGDVLVQVGAVRVTSTIDVERGLLDKAAGEKVSVLARRGSEEKRFELILQSADRASPAPDELVWRKLGVRVSPVGGEVVSIVKKELHGGLAVISLAPESLAAKAGIQRGDILVGLHHWETLTVDNVAFVLGHPDLASFNPLCFYIIRTGQVRRGWLQQVD